MQNIYTEDYYVEIGKRIATRRKALGITQFKLAEILDISNNHLSSIETGAAKPSLDLFIKICEVLEITPNHLILGCMFSKNVPENIIDTIRNLNDTNTQLMFELANSLYVKQLEKL